MKEDVKSFHEKTKFAKEKGSEWIEIVQEKGAIDRKRMEIARNTRVNSKMGMTI